MLPVPLTVLLLYEFAATIIIKHHSALRPGPAMAPRACPLACSLAWGSSSGSPPAEARLHSTSRLQPRVLHTGNLAYQIRCGRGCVGVVVGDSLHLRVEKSLRLWLATGAKADILVHPA